MLVFFQEGIPGIFFPELERRGIWIKRFAAGGDLTPDAHAVFFRANFRLDRSVLDRLPQLRLAALVSTGSDNVDLEELTARKVQFVTGEGANARAVFDYVMQALLIAEIDLKHDSVGIVGAGRIGGMLLQFFAANGIRSAYYDPYLAVPGSLEETLACKYVSFHVPLTAETHGMLNEKYFASVQKKTLLIQTCRGGIWDADYYRSMAGHPHLKVLAQDVYPTEPPAANDLVCARFSTPHIAGYSARGRLGGILRGIKALLPDFSEAGLWPEAHAWFLDAENQRFRSAPETFNALRDGYFWRKEFHEYNAAERAAFKARFPQAPESLFALPAL